MALPKLGTSCVINIYDPIKNTRKWGTTHPNRIEGNLEGYLEGLEERWIIYGSGASIDIERKSPA